MDFNIHTFRLSPETKKKLDTLKKQAQIEYPSINVTWNIFFQLLAEQKQNENKD